MGCDAAGNRYYENRIDYPLGQHRWVGKSKINYYDWNGTTSFVEGQLAAIESLRALLIFSLVAFVPSRQTHYLYQSLHQNPATFTILMAVKLLRNGTVGLPI